MPEDEQDGNSAPTHCIVSIDQDGHCWVHVMLLSDFAVQPVKRDRGAKEILLFSPHYCYIRPGSGVGVKTDVALELARGVYGQVVSCPDAQLGTQVKLEGSQIEPCSMANVTLYVFNIGQFPCVIKRGDLVEAVLVLQGFIPHLDIQRCNGSGVTII